MSGRRDPLEALAQRWGAAGYLVVILGTEVLTMLTGQLAWSPTGSGGVVQLVVYVIGVVGGVLLWRHCPARAPAAGLLRWFLVLALGMWALEAGRQLIGGDHVSFLWLTVPLLLGMTWRKPPDAAEAQSAVTGVAVVFATAVVIAVASEALGLTQSWYSRLDRRALQDFDASYYWLPLSEALGIDGRWTGPFPHPNHAGPIGALLIVVGLCRAGGLRWVLLLVGFLVLLLTSSRTSMVGALAGSIAVLAAAVLWDRRLSWSQWIVMGATVGAVLLSLIYSVFGVSALDTGGAPVSATDQVTSASGRSDVWSAYAQIWRESLWWGSPDGRILLAVQTGELPAWAATAHNLLLDSLVRFGLLGSVLVVLALVVLGILAVRAAASATRVGLGLLFVILGCALTEAIIFWRVWAVSTIILFLAVIASVGPYPPARWPKRRSSRPDATISAAD